ncbi:hypothetical protein O181_006122 [Austropuccinia psidii MF-1]|uniref:Uncharacterized protein n=1 Tax=Austropuccinia psidii MF-1 TaxID=1389203 RepID=A0A9Q3GHB2_9BASI|nr:hypothetical protein [Austropuccinia psidii MF-1]
MLISILGICSKEELEKEEEYLTLTSKDQQFDPDTPDSARLEEWIQEIKNKIMDFAKMSHVYAFFQEEPEIVSELKSMAGKAKLPYGLEEFSESYSPSAEDAGEPAQTRSQSGTMHSKAALADGRLPFSDFTSSTLSVTTSLAIPSHTPNQQMASESRSGTPGR